MDYVWIDAKIINPITDYEIKVKALIDSGTTFTIIPWEIHEKLNFKNHR